MFMQKTQRPIYNVNMRQICNANAQLYEIDFYQP